MTKQYRIVVRRYWYGRPSRAGEYVTDSRLWRGTRAEARLVIAGLEATSYHLTSGESGRPTYHIYRAED